VIVDAVEEIKGRLSIEDVVGPYVELKRSGSSLKGLCPFHQEKTPSFYVRPSHGTFHCFGCGRGGDQFSFLMEMEHLGFPDALKRLAEQAGVTLPEREARKPSLKGRLHEVNDAAQDFFAEALQGNEGRIVRDYLESRRFGEDAVGLFGLGYAPRGREMLVPHLRSRGFDDRLILAAGLALQEEIGGRLRDRFRGRLMFPIRDASGKISGFGGRILGEGQPKYLNSPQTEIFDKSAVLFGIELAADSIRQTRRAVLVEGYLDAVRAHLGGYMNTVASLGTAVTVQQLTSLARMTDAVILALDPDSAGQNAAARTAITALMEVTRARGRAPGAAGAVDLRIARLPEGHGDPDELIRDEPQLWEKAIEASKPAFDFFFEQTMTSLDRSAEGWRQEAIDRLLPLIQQFSDSAGWQAEWVQRLAAETGIDPGALQRSIPRPARPRGRQQPLRGSEVASRVTSQALVTDPVVEIERGLLALLLQVLVIPREATAALDGVRLERPELQTILEALRGWQNYEYELLRDRLPDEVRELADSLRARRTPLPPEGKTSLAVRLILARLQQARLQRQLRSAIETLKEMPSEDQLAATDNLGGLYQRIRETDGEVRELETLVLRGNHNRAGAQ
jgi:DNA primase